MAVVTRYFSVTAAGAGDGTTWADRAALFSSGNWSSIIKDFNFSAGDTLLCHIGPGTYSGITDTLTGTDFANPPTSDNRLILFGCDSSGNPLSPPDPDWTPDMPEWDNSGLPRLQAVNVQIISVTGAWIETWLLAFEHTAAGGAAVANPIATWCSYESSSSNTSHIVAGNVMNKCWVRVTGSAYSAVSSSNSLYYTRLVGNPGATSGSRRGLVWTSSSTILKSAVVNNPGIGIENTGTSAGIVILIDRTLIAGNGSDGIKLPPFTGTPTNMLRIINSLVTGNGGYGVNGNVSFARATIENCRLRDNASGNWQYIGGAPDLFNYTTDPFASQAEADAAEYVDAASGDFRIKASAAIAGMGFGISVEPSSGGTPTLLCHGHAS